MKKKAKHSPFHIHGFLKDIKVEHFKLKRKTSFKSFQSKAEFKKISSAISRNLVEFMTSMMARGGYETHTSSDVICVYSDFPTAELNYVFNLSVEEELENMKKAISFGEAKGVPFSLPRGCIAFERECKWSESGNNWCPNGRIRKLASCLH